ncbi:hypothetical protein F4808DRAFT_463528 [Astrocystis sublimbata]|nr:hypothetical protein F4808DRAFT_463528 [Astrocystis sublimbata]
MRSSAALHHHHQLHLQSQQELPSHQLQNGLQRTQQQTYIPPSFQQDIVGYHNNNNSHAASPSPNMRKRKPESQENERLSKRLSLLHLEKNGQKLYVPVEASGSSNPTQSSPLAPSPAIATSTSQPTPTTDDDDSMRLDDTKHKVYIYDLDAELTSSSDEGYSDADSLPGSPTSSGRVVFMSNMDKHLRRAPVIPPSVFANSDGQLAGHDINDMQMVLYSAAPSSLTIPAEQDSVRRAILEARARVREKKEKSENETTQSRPSSSPTSLHEFGVNFVASGFGRSPTPSRGELVVVDESMGGANASANGVRDVDVDVDDDGDVDMDAMDMD